MLKKILAVMSGLFLFPSTLIMYGTTIWWMYDYNFVVQRVNIDGFRGGLLTLMLVDVVLTFLVYLDVKALID